MVSDQRAGAQDIVSLLSDRRDGRGSAELVRTLLDSMTAPSHLLRFIDLYGQFNAMFAGGVASLAGAFHTQPTTFVDASAPSSTSDRSSLVASEVFFAAEDEYADRLTGARVTHRGLAQDLLEGMAEYWQVPVPDPDIAYAGFVDQVRRRVVDGYGVSRVLSDGELFRCLGFHLGAELLADEEFGLIDRHLRRVEPDLVTHLATTSAESGAPLYQWISLHVVVEMEHFVHACTAAELAVRFYIGPLSGPFEHVLAGFTDFQDFQQEVFTELFAIIS